MALWNEPVTIVDKFNLAADQQIFNLSTSYPVGKNAIEVYRNGVRQRLGDEYTETSSTSITFNSTIKSGENVVVVISTVW